MNTTPVGAETSASTKNFQSLGRTRKLKLLPGTVLEKNICGRHFKEVCDPYLKCLQSLITSHPRVNEIDGVLGNKFILLVVFKDVLVFMTHCFHEAYK